MLINPVTGLDDVIGTIDILEIAEAQFYHLVDTFLPLIALKMRI